MQDHSPSDRAWIPTPGDRLGYCLYRSIAHPQLDRSALDRILEQSRHRNRMRGLTGCLHYENGTFFQWLEGPWQQVFHLLDMLREDDRHMSMTVLDQGTLTQRLFKDWDMRFSDHATASLFEWLADWNSRTDDPRAYVDRVNAFLKSVSQTTAGA
ncbi:BLUF domain-containing protein [Paracoccus sp. WLY502]|uniref:BLUF domain-containing protein n=1 Tax=Paracoccus yibinensis TaxID=3068891 RepID=UPI002796C208|nr:BLUF domain-containing protein [Paracoccus sp. WLY502]MDQ1901164.1 BLUF domain-containing protein [Paracoccus sp. WLY502]